MSNRLLSSVLVLALVAACGGTTVPGTDRPRNDTVTPDDLDVALAPADELFAGVPGNDELPAAGKQDATYPKKFFDLVAKQTPVRNQASRGVCSIFATIGLMEHLYLLDGTLENPDFSEQYLQWSAKFEVGSFPNTSGSNASYNLQAITEYGIPLEQAWPYETREWGVSNDPACTGEESSRPTRCFTNGEPPQAAKDAQKYHLPAGKWISSRAYSIKGHMVNKKTAVVIGVRFYYQAWNHGSAKLPTNAEYFREGYVLYPNAEDKKQEPAGHAILLVGWDDELEVQKLDKEGKPLFDSAGKPVMEKGFFIFKNSWGTGRFGVNNPHGDGYGYISQKYVAEYGNAMVSDKPKLAPPAEICDDGEDNDDDGDVDCEDSQCANATLCQEEEGGTAVYESTTAKSIPDNSTTGVKSTIDVEDEGEVKSLAVTVDITHTYRGDLTLKLKKGTKTVTLLEADGDDSENLQRTFEVSDFNGVEASGVWTLTVIDEASQDTGTLNGWSLTITR